VKIYVAGTFARRNDLRPYRDRLWAMGHHVTSSWLDEVAKPEGMDHETFFKKLANKDRAEVLASDLVICETGDTLSEGKNTELGIALGNFQNTLIWIVGERRSVFHELADKHFETWEELLVCPILNK